MQSSAPSQAPGQRSRTILFVDDEPDIRDSMQQLIGSLVPVAVVVTAESGAAGLALLAEGPVDLIISDFHMPGMDGIAFLCECRRLHPGIPRVMFTSFATEDLANRAVREAFVDSFLPKAASADALVATVAKLLAALPVAPVSGRAGI
jgi:CheY-like chemotaxis protein